MIQCCQAGTKQKEKPQPKNALPAYLEDRAIADRAKMLTNSIKQKRKDKVGKWSVPIPKVKPLTEDEMFKVVKSGTSLSLSLSLCLSVCLSGCLSLCLSLSLSLSLCLSLSPCMLACLASSACPSVHLNGNHCGNE